MDVSGSYREGFRLESSDRDYMVWCCDLKLINNITKARLYDRTKHAIILMEDNDTQPGFVKLQLLTSSQNKYIVSSAVPANDRIYISSLLWQQSSFESFQNNKSLQRVTNHGPCANAYVGPIGHDVALCIAGAHWPAVTQAWIERCLSHAWPPVAVLEEIFIKRISL
jgi:hypothetical protein